MTLACLSLLASPSLENNRKMIPTKSTKTSNFTLLQCIEIYLQYLHVSPRSYLPSYLCFLRICQTLASPVFTARSGNFWALQAQGIIGIIVSQPLNIHGKHSRPPSSRPEKNGWHAMILLWMHFAHAIAMFSCYWLLQCSTWNLKRCKRGSTLTTVSSDWILTVPANTNSCFLSDTYTEAPEIWQSTRANQTHAISKSNPGQKQGIFHRIHRFNNWASTFRLFSTSIVAASGSLDDLCHDELKFAKCETGLPLKSRQVEFLAWWLKVCWHKEGLHGSLKFTKPEGPCPTWSQRPQIIVFTFLRSVFHTCDTWRVISPFFELFGLPRGWDVRIASCPLSCW